jgi:large subunit ribosomal protein L1
MARRSKKYREKAALVEPRLYPIEEAVDLLTRLSTARFDATAEVHVNLACDPKQGDQQVRATVTLPHGTGKERRIAAVVPPELMKEVETAGAARAGEADLLKEIEQGKIDFDVLIATPSLMRNLGKVARILGQRGLMPNPKSGTVTDDPVRTIGELRRGKIEFRSDKQAIIHAVFGKLSFGKEKLVENLRALLLAIREAKPSSLKGDYIQSLSIAPSMGPSVKVDLKSFSR